MSNYAALSDQQLADAIAQKAAAAETERAGAALLGVPARLAAAKRLEEEIAGLKAERARRGAAT